MLGCIIVSFVLLSLYSDDENVKIARKQDQDNLLEQLRQESK
jgi:hypothetical protein